MWVVLPHRGIAGVLRGRAMLGVRLLLADMEEVVVALVVQEVAGLLGLAGSVEHPLFQEVLSHMQRGALIVVVMRLLIREMEDMAHSGLTLAGMAGRGLSFFPTQEAPWRRTMTQDARISRTLSPRSSRL